MKEGFYHVGDRLEGEVIIMPAKLLEAKHITLELYFVMESATETRRLRAAEIVLSGSKKLIPHVAVRLPFRADNVFGRITSHSPALKSYWEAVVVIERPREPSVATRLGKFWNKRAEQRSTFRVPVVYGPGNYRVEAQELPVPLFDSRGWWFGLAAISAAVIIPLFANKSEPGGGTIPFGLLLFILMVVLIYQYVYMNRFRATPMEVLPTRDGSLRIRVLDRGDDHFKKAKIGYRLIEEHRLQNNNEYEVKTRTRLERKDIFPRVARPDGAYLTVHLPWVTTNEPTSFRVGHMEYRWELFLQQQNPITGHTLEVKWPLKVSRERFKLIGPPTATEEEEERLELKDLAERRREAAVRSTPFRANHRGA